MTIAAAPDLLRGASLEVLPRAAAGVADFAAILPRGTRVYVAHLAGTPVEDVIATARRLRAEGMEPMPHIPARLIADRTMLSDWIARYRGEADVKQALVLAGGAPQPVGDYATSMDLLGSGAFDGFERLHVAGHPEGSRDIDPDGGVRNLSDALEWKRAFAERTDARMALVTQFCFEAAPVITWAEAIRAAGVHLPIHVGVAGPGKLQTLLRYAIACGVGPSLRVLQRRAADLTKLLTPHTPTDLAAELAAHKAAHPNFAVEAVHIFPLGGIGAAAEWLRVHKKDEE